MNLLTGKLGSTPSVLGLFCLAYIPLSEIPTPTIRTGISVIRRKKKKVEIKLPKDITEDDPMIPVMLTLLLEG